LALSRITSVAIEAGYDPVRFQQRGRSDLGDDPSDCLLVVHDPVSGKIGVLGHSPRVERCQQHPALEHQLLAIFTDR
jgi:hypothetical protein